MRNYFLIASVPLALAGCIPFVGDSGPTFPDPIEGYTTVAMSQQPQQGVAACIGRLFGTQPVEDAAGQYSVPSAQSAQDALFVVRTVTNHGHPATQTMIRSEQSREGSTADAVQCAANADFVRRPAEAY